MLRTSLDVLHLDMDCFFAAVEVQAAPELRGRPVIVGGLGPRGVVAAASYEARVFGVRSAMPMGEARRRCPSGVYLAGRHSLYADKSRHLLELLKRTTPIVEPIAMDEAFLDVSGAHRLLGASAQIARALKSDVSSELGLECSVGVGRSKLVAKLASRAAKPQVDDGALRPGVGVFVVTVDEESEFLRSHAVASLPGAGPKTSERLARIGVRTVADLELFGRDALVRLLGKSHGGSLFDLATGLDDRPVEADRAVKSIGSEETFDADVRDRMALESKAREQAENVGSRCRSREVVARTVSIKVRFGDFTTVSRSRTLQTPTSSSAEIAVVSVELLGEVDLLPGVRLLGVSLSGLDRGDTSASTQLDLFSSSGSPDDTERGRYDEAERAADDIRRRFGPSSIRSVAAAGRPAPRNGPTNRPITDMSVS
ncbi:MAG TPA: DNA polymerase IV [Acidimicrobiales bacterium]|nr:DNA polymerase IV [Acidimicrobiales bacterium]